MVDTMRLSDQVPIRSDPRFDVERRFCCSWLNWLFVTNEISEVLSV